MLKGNRRVQRKRFVRAITDGPAAIVAVAERPPHLVIVDWNMQGFAAIELIQGGAKGSRAAGGQAHHLVGAQLR